jgi:pimeloyl-ACP methyl ester carboxylesterase
VQWVRALGLDRVVLAGHDLGGGVVQIAAESIEAHWAHYAAHDPAEAFIRQVRSLNVQDTLAVRDDLPGLRIPTRVVWGESDFFQKVRFGEFFATDLGTELRRIPGGKHFTPEDHPGVVADAINDLVREVRGRGA